MTTMFRICRFVAITFATLAPFVLWPLFLFYVLTFSAIALVEIVAWGIESFAWAGHDYRQQPVLRRMSPLLWVVMVTGMMPAQIIIGFGAVIAWRFTPAVLRRPIAALLWLAYAGLTAWMWSEVKTGGLDPLTTMYTVVYSFALAPFFVYALCPADRTPLVESPRVVV